MFDLEDNENAEKTYWRILNYKSNPNIYLIQNYHNNKFLEIQILMKQFAKIHWHMIFLIIWIKWLQLIKLCEELELRPFDFEILKNEPIDVFMKYIDYTDK